jgi:hypothetical protein
MLAVLTYTSLNYTPFLTTLIMYPLFLIPTAHLMLSKQMEIMHDPYTGLPVKDDADWLNLQWGFVFFLINYSLVTHYLRQRDLLSLTIEKVII